MRNSSLPVPSVIPVRNQQIAEQRRSKTTCWNLAHVVTHAWTNYLRHRVFFRSTYLFYQFSIFYVIFLPLIPFISRSNETRFFLNSSGDDTSLYVMLNDSATRWLCQDTTIMEWRHNRKDILSPVWRFSSQVKTGDFNLGKIHEPRVMSYILLIHPCHM